jgi:carbamoyltransferase
MKKNYFILGVQSYANHDTGASILKIDKSNNVLDYVAISEERLIRKKHPYSFPIHSINYCMEYFNINKLSEISFIISDWIRVKRWLRSGPAYNYQLFDYIKEKLNFDKKKIIQIDHHLAHAASTYYSSGYKESAILIVDGNGSDCETNSFFFGKKNKITLLAKSKNHGIGSLYTNITKNILNLGDSGEGKTMGLAPYGKQNKNIKIQHKLNGVHTNFSNFMRRMPYSDVLNHINKNFRPEVLKIKYPTASKKNIMNKIFCDWAYAVQDLTEKVLLHLGREIYKLKKIKNICLAGGVALNSVANNVLLKKTKFKNMFVFPACSDAGIPFGLVLWGYHNIFKGKKRVKFNNAYTGRQYPRKEIIAFLKKYNFVFKETSPKEIATLIAKGNVIGNFFGKSEYGPRALGNRSIIADARNPKMRDYINNKVKHREIFRPFAPSILEEFSGKFFDVTNSPFMLQVAKSKKSKLIPSAIHVDDTARVQTVNRKQNNNYYSIIKEFYNLTGVPVILNTSFNDAGEPLVETPQDAILCFLKTKIDCLILDNILILKSEQKNINNKIKILDSIRKKKINSDEKKLIRKFTTKFSNNEYKIKQKKENIIAKNYTLERPVSKINDFIKKFNSQNKRLLIIGSEDHTNVLSQIFNLDKNRVVFFDINKNDIINKKKRIHNFLKVKKLDLSKYYKEIFISSFEYQDEIIEKFKLKKYFTPYDNSSRSIIDSYYIKKFSDKTKLHSKNIY